MISEPLDLAGVESSYARNDYGAMLYGLVRATKPGCVVELGTYMGYSGLHLAAALRDNQQRTSRLSLIDLWERYDFNRCSIGKAQVNFWRNGFDPQFLDAEAEAAAARFADGAVDFLHVDISNDGEKLERVFAAWLPKLSANALAVIEGGSAGRDRVEWMRLYHRPLIRNWLRSEWVAERFSCLTLEPFPSMTLMRLK